jgi:predicted glycoside hydrolase/deacetylase ChbG (UPF0249 family)
MRRLIVNADDYGRTSDISRGIREAHLRGVVTSTTCMMNSPTTANDIALALRDAPTLQMGVHLVLTMGRPLLPLEAVFSLTDANGNFYKYDPFLKHLTSITIQDVKAEWRAQIEAFIRASRRQPTHLDSHHHASYFSPELFRTMLELAREYDCAIRFPFTGEVMPELVETNQQVPDLVSEFNPRRPDGFVSAFYDEGATKEHLLSILEGLPEGTSELMCHPGHVDGASAAELVYNYPRAREFQILTDPSIQEVIQTNGIELTTFAGL